MSDHELSTHPLVWMIAAGIFTGLGQLLASTEKLTWRIVIGRAMSSAALGGAAGLAYAWFPSMPIEAAIGGACALASLGTSGLELLVKRFLGVK